MQACLRSTDMCARIGGDELLQCMAAPHDNLPE
ncbi:GGDEF domain-containing protein [Rheinheimera pacifica]|nr:GGDEF domain-containing protein [Rheinheimera pacifica]